MDLYVFRHATAVDVGAPDAPDDASRYLTDEGKTETRDAAKGVKRFAKGVAAILTSPYPRARQTAEIAAKVMGVPGDGLIDVEALRPGASFDEIAPLVNKAAEPGGDNAAVMIVGHNPDLEEIVGVAVGGRPDLPINLKKAGFAIVRFDGPARAGRGELRLLLTAKLLSLIGKA